MSVKTGGARDEAVKLGKGRKGNHFLWFVGIAASFGGFVFGYDVIVMSGAVPVVADQFRFSPFQLGLFVSCVLWGCAVGSALAGWFLDGLGRRKSLISAAAVLLFSALGSASAPGPVFLILLRFIGGLGCGLATVVCPLLVSELAPDAKRGRLVSLYHLYVCLGIVAAGHTLLCPACLWRERIVIPMGMVCRGAVLAGYVFCRSPAGAVVFFLFLCPSRKSPVAYEKESVP